MLANVRHACGVQYQFQKWPALQQLVFILYNTYRLYEPNFFHLLIYLSRYNSAMRFFNIIYWPCYIGTKTYMPGFRYSQIWICTRPVDCTVVSEYIVLINLSTPLKTSKHLFLCFGTVDWNSVAFSPNQTRAYFFEQKYYKVLDS